MVNVHGDAKSFSVGNRFSVDMVKAMEMARKLTACALGVVLQFVRSAVPMTLRQLWHGWTAPHMKQAFQGGLPRAKKS